jgi:tetrahydromethanopterin S-methyltransferase subunit H
MAVLHLNFVPTTQHGQLLRSALDNFERGFESLNDVKGAMQLMIDGDGSQASHFVTVAQRFGFENTGADAKAAWDELNSLLFKLNTNGSVSDVNAAMLQLLNKLR